MAHREYQHLPKTSITLGAFFEVCGVGSIVHIGTENGSGWCFTGTCREASEKFAPWADRKITWIYFHDGREAIPGHCTKMEPGFGIRVEGSEDGSI
jgi:hypothetical protein